MHVIKNFGGNISSDYLKHVSGSVQVLKTVDKLNHFKNGSQHLKKKKNCVPMKDWKPIESAYSFILKYSKITVSDQGPGSIEMRKKS